MKNTLKRMLCLLLALIMTVGLAAGALAEGEGQTQTEGNPPENPPVDTPVDPPVENTLKQLQLNTTALELYLGQKAMLSYKTNPDDYKGEASWSSSDGNVVKVDNNGNLSAEAVGMADITVTVGNLSAVCKVTVSEDKVTSFEVSGSVLRGDAITVSGKTNFTLKGTSAFDSGRTADGAEWLIDNMNVLSVGSDDEFTTLSPGETTVTATSKSDAGFFKTITVRVKDAPLTGLSITGDGVNNGRSASMVINGTLRLSAKKLPETTFNAETIVWSSSDDKTAWVDSDGTVTAVKKGTVRITASCRRDSSEPSKSVSEAITITVSEPSADITDSVSLGGRDLSFSGIYNELRSKFKSVYGLYPSDSYNIRFSSLGSGSYGTLYTNSGSPAAANKDYALSAVKEMSFTPKGAGKYEIAYTLTDTDSGAKKSAAVSGKITITVTGSKNRNINIRLRDESAYTFSSTATIDKISAANAMSTAIKDASGANYSYIKFSSPSSSSKRVGTLYPDSTKKTGLEDYLSYSCGSGSGKQSSVSKLFFEPKDEGIYEIGYTAYDAKDCELCSGELVIEVGAAEAAAVTITLDSESSYTFSDRTKKSKTSAASAIDNAVYNKTGKSYSYIQFGAVSSGNSVGTLYSNSRKTSISTARNYYCATNEDYSVSDLYFVPEKAGTYVRSFTAYSASGSQLLSGTLKIVVPGGAASAGVDIYFNTTTGSTITLGEDVFASWFRKQEGSSHKLAYVTFDEVSREYGSFRHNNSSFTPGSSTEYYSGGYSGSASSNAQYLKNVTFTAGSSVGCVSVDFTCYGGTSSSSSGTKDSGTFCVYVTKNIVRGISYDVKDGSAVTLGESDFASVYKNAMSLGSSTPKFYIELLEIPSNGTLYYKYAGSNRAGTRLTGSNFDDYSFHIGYGGSYDSVGELTYIPASGATGNVSVRYLARDTSGEPLYVGSVSFDVGRAQTVSASCGADGYTFRLSDFYSSGDSDPVAYAAVSQPDSGELMLNYVNGRGVPVDSSVRLYTTSPASGAYPVSALSYIPRAGFSGNAEIEYMTVTESGKTRSGTFVIAVSSRTSSSRFKDVNSSGTGAWASDSIDFAYKWGLVNGTGEDTFSPDSTMSRAMLVAVLYRAAGSPEVSGSCKFSDVPGDAYYYDAVIWASNSGIVTGTSSTTFSPNRDVNREQVAAFLHRFANYNGQSVSVSGSLSGYADQSSVSGYAVEPMTWAVGRGYITSASASGKVLSPGGNATRAQVAVMIHRFLTY